MLSFIGFGMDESTISSRTGAAKADPTGLIMDEATLVAMIERIGDHSATHATALAQIARHPCAPADWRAERLAEIEADPYLLGGSSGWRTLVGLASNPATTADDLHRAVLAAAQTGPSTRLLNMVDRAALAHHAVSKATVAVISAKLPDTAWEGDSHDWDDLLAVLRLPGRLLPASERRRLTDPAIAAFANDVHMANMSVRRFIRFAGNEPTLVTPSQYAQMESTAVLNIAQR